MTPGEIPLEVALVLKLCRGCGRELPRTEFYKNVSRKDGLTILCKSCEKTRVENYQKSPAGKVAVARYRKSEAWRKKHRVCMARYGKTEKGKAKVRAYVRSEKYKIRQANRRASTERKAYKKTYRVAWGRTEKGKALTARDNYKRRIRKLKPTEIVATLTAAEWCEILKRYNYACAYCGRKNAELGQDHVIPVNKGGQHTRDNVVPACQSCNSKKRDKSWKPLENTV